MPRAAVSLLRGRNASRRALPWTEVDDVLAGLEPLNPYARGTVPALIKLEDQNFGGGGGRPVKL